MKKENKELLDKCFNKVFDAMDLAPAPPDDALIVFNEGSSCITYDDSCYILRNHVGGQWKPSSYIFKEALENLNKLPKDPRDGIIAFLKHKP